MKKGSLYPHTLMYLHGTLTQNDHWVESHMWSQQTWRQRSCRGQWPLVQGFENKGHCVHIPWCIFMGLGHNDPWVVSYMWPQQTQGQRSSRVNDLWFKFWKQRSPYPRTLMYFHELGYNDPWVDRVTHVTSTELGSNVI